MREEWERAKFSLAVSIGLSRRRIAAASVELQIEFDKQLSADCPIGPVIRRVAHEFALQARYLAFVIFAV